MQHLTPVLCRVPGQIGRSITCRSVYSAVSFVPTTQIDRSSVGVSEIGSADFKTKAFSQRSRSGGVVVRLDTRVRAMATEAGIDSPVLTKPRKVVRTLLSKEQPEGDGATVRRSIGRPEMKQLDPFLLLDHFSVSPPAGFPDHPHRGFETVTYMLEGVSTHQDFAGHKGIIGPGDLQWMTAGRGIVHCEMPGGKTPSVGLQLWVNLAAKDKMVDPKYQELVDKDVPKVEKDGIKVSVIAGESFGVKSPVYTRTPTMYLDFTMQPGTVLHQAVPEGWNAFIYILQGKLIIGSEDASPVDSFHTVQLGPGDGLNVWNRADTVARFVLIGGQPLNEPVVQHGPFVMNTKEEIMQTIRDYQFGRNGFERARGWQSDAVQV
ncbi:quercetin 2,3-dioxygenase [Marchantia polymorpha subsp. ruderalis]|uniref:Pirin-like protein n=3 Tax=Marchantia polymorpha TaxID=3197 RepID=A0AAF6BK55_MARPO|nr:hypothetical protein MARPO_0134s0025 [Marchantia polymorpha]BBN12389.1 hypothetical protein Mp_5g19670 [Marchantia polymorpha subsp. ruderalis]|eukprot:PTQ29814.1 hypothetical protein MARPO_0134s0025 [Marchantia polymorpha]